MIFGGPKQEHPARTFSNSAKMMLCTCRVVGTKLTKAMISYCGDHRTQTTRIDFSEIISEYHILSSAPGVPQ